MQRLPIGIDSFREIREDGRYYVDKTLMIGDFIRCGDKVALITRPRRFGKTLGMTMLREFFDITADSRAIFDGLAIMDTEYAGQINSRPVIYMTFKDCKSNTAESLIFDIRTVILGEYAKYHPILRGNADESILCYYNFFTIYEMLRKNDVSMDFLKISIATLEQALYEYYEKKPILLIDEYDQPLISSFVSDYHERVKDFFSGLYGSALKGQDCLHQALLTGIQRVVKESIFSQLNSIRVYTVTDERYSHYFGFTESETQELLSCAGLELDGQVKRKYDGYVFGGAEVYNPWSILNYADTGQLESYWINTSTNALVRDSVAEADELFHKNFDTLLKEGTARVNANMASSFIELRHNSALWGLLINAGYLTVVSRANGRSMTVRIPNGEVREEFIEIVANRARVSSQDLQDLFQCLFEKDMDGFMDVYRELVISCTSYFDAKENAYHMLFLGMCITLRDIYKITSNIESGYGRSDIRLESLTEARLPEGQGRPHIIIEFKQGEDIERLKDEALQQILDNRYYEGLRGEVLCMGVAHDRKRCALAHETITCEGT